MGGGSGGRSLILLHYTYILYAQFLYRYMLYICCIYVYIVLDSLEQYIESFDSIAQYICIVIVQVFIYLTSLT